MQVLSRRAMLVAAICVVSLAAIQNVACSQQPVSQEEIAKMQEAIPAQATATPAQPRKVLLFGLYQGFRHSSIPYCANAFELMGDKTGAYSSVVSDDMALFDAQRLAQFDVVVFNNTTNLKFEDSKRREALMAFVRGGGGIVGVHAATDNFKNFPEAAAMIGGVFAGHPWQRCPTKLDDPTHPLVAVFQGKGFTIDDEIYKFGGPYSRQKLRVLLSMDAAQGDPDNKGREDHDNAVAWIQDVGEGRVFFCSLGHRHEIFWNPTILRFYLAGIQYAAGDIQADATPSAQLNPQPKPVLP